jgi:predicted nucleic acid-binding protein
MNLPDIADNSRAFADANIILYALQRRSRQCRDFLARCASGAIEATISTVVLAEIAHRRMTLEAQAKGVTGSNPSKALSAKPELVRTLSVYAQDVRDLLDGGLLVESVQPEDFLVALDIQERWGLLTNDALNLAVARRLNLEQIASADQAFNRVQGVIVYQPEDVAS